jgi:aminopeptidase N
MTGRGPETNVYWMMITLLIKLICLIGVVRGAIDEYRLVTNTQPSSYDLWLNVDLPELEINGEVTVNIFVSQRSNFVELNCVNLTIDESSVKLEQNGGALQLTRLLVNETTEKCRLEFNRDLEELLSATLTMKFTGAIRTDLKGLYSTSYYVGTERRFLAATQFQATYARMVFPCYDEPAMKATFRIRIAHDQALTALSNMPQASRAIVEGWATTSFQETPVMSTFVLAFIVSDFKSVQSADGKIRVFAPVSVQFCFHILGAHFQSIPGT